MPIFKRPLQVTVTFSRENQRKLLSTRISSTNNASARKWWSRSLYRKCYWGIFLTLSIHYFRDNNSMSFFRLNVHLQLCSQSLILSYDMCTLYTALTDFTFLHFFRYTPPRMSLSTLIVHLHCIYTINISCNQPSYFDINLIQPYRMTTSFKL